MYSIWAAIGRVGIEEYLGWKEMGEEDGKRRNGENE
jgi:hypothetical protein